MHAIGYADLAGAWSHLATEKQLALCPSVREVLERDEPQSCCHSTDVSLQIRCGVCLIREGSVLSVGSDGFHACICAHW